MPHVLKLCHACVYALVCTMLHNACTDNCMVLGSLSSSKAERHRM